MKVFISWSGERSREVANVLHDWLSCVLQAIKPWVSTRDIDRGSLWFHEISGQLQESTVGIICLTQQNKNQPWILFEAGALAKGLTTQRVCTMLVDLTAADVKDPLAQFNHTLPSREGMRGLVITLNAALGSLGLEAKVLEQVFETYWPQFESSFAAVLATTPTAQADAPLNQNEVLTELLGTVRTMSNRLARVEQRESSEVSELGMVVDPKFKTKKLFGQSFQVEMAKSRAAALIRQGLGVDEVLNEILALVPSPIARRIVSEAFLEGKKDA